MPQNLTVDRNFSLELNFYALSPLLVWVDTRLKLLYIISTTMKVKTWVRLVLYTVAFILIQVPPRKYTPTVDDDENYDSDPNKILLFGKYLSNFMNNAVMFVTVELRIFKKIFVEYDVASLDNFSIIRDIFDYGFEMQENFWNIVSMLLYNNI